MAFSATATWSGDLKGGNGVYSLGSGAASDISYGFADRFESAGGSTPEELIGAALAGCFVMYLSGQLGEVQAERLTAEARVSLGEDNGPKVTSIRIKLTAKIPGIDKAKFDEVVAISEKGCPISRLVAGNTEVKVSATLES